MKTSRREFLKTSGATMTSAAVLSQIPLHLLAGNPANKLSFGFQVWTIRKKLIADFPGTIKAMSDLGYSIAGFKPLNKMSGSEMKQIVEDNGMICTSSHFTSGELNESLDNRIDWASELGMKQMILSSFWLAKDATVDDYRRAAEKLNLIAEKETETPIGEGMVDWPDFFKAARVGGVKNFYVEMDPNTFKPSAEFLNKL